MVCERRSVPGEGVCIPPSPEESEKECAAERMSASAAKQHLARCRRRIAVKAGDLQAEHHAGSGAAEDGEQGRSIANDDGEGNALRRRR